MAGRCAIAAVLLTCLWGSDGLSCRLSAADPEVAPAPELSVEALVEQVLARNPSLAQMTAAWEAATARYPQAIALDDPMFTAWAGPASIGSRDVDFAYRLELSQK